MFDFYVTIQADMPAILERLDKIMTTQADAVVQLTTIATQLDKISAETSALLSEVAALQAAAATGGDVSTDLQSAIDAVAQRAASIDQLVPDAPTA